MVSTAASGGRPSGGPAHDGGRHPPCPRHGPDPRHGATPHPVTRIDSAEKRRAPRSVDERDRHVRALHRASTGSLLTLETGSELPIGINLSQMNRGPDFCGSSQNRVGRFESLFEGERVRTGPRSPHLTWSSESRETPATKKTWLDFRRHDSGVRRHQATGPGGSQHQGLLNP